MSNFIDSQLSPETCPTAGDVIQETLDAANELTEQLDPVERIIALVVLQIFIEAQKSLMGPEMLFAFQQTLETSSFTTFPILGEADDGEE